MKNEIQEMKKKKEKNNEEKIREDNLLCFL